MEAPYKADFTPNQTSDGNCVIFTLDDLYWIIDFDLQNAYSSIGNQLFKQHIGCPIGGLLSSFYGNTTCAYHENMFLDDANNKHVRNHIWGIRQMDDLTLFVTHKKTDTNAERNVAYIKHAVQNNMYKGGLEAEIQAPDEDTTEKYVHKFAGHEIHTLKHRLNIYVTTLNENKTSIRTAKSQSKIRYPHWHTYTNVHSKVGNIIGSVHRIRTQNTYRRDFNEAIQDLIMELNCIGYPTTIIKNCMYKLARQQTWRIMLDETLSQLSKQRPLHPYDPAHTLTTPAKPKRHQPYNNTQPR